MRVKYFRERRPGPEAALEDAVVERLPALFDHRDRPVWTAGSLRVGAGMPDLTTVSYDAEVTSLSGFHNLETRILAYLRAVRTARVETVADHVNGGKAAVRRSIERLVEIEAVTAVANAVALSAVWRNILPEIITIEVKLSDWRRAVQQAARNTIFAHRSFVAFPNRVAARVRSEPVFRHHGVGILGIDGIGGVTIQRKARNQRPTVWAYYFHVASMTARYA